MVDQDLAMDVRSSSGEPTLPALSIFSLLTAIEWEAIIVFPSLETNVCGRSFTLRPRPCRCRYSYCSSHLRDIGQWMSDTQAVSLPVYAPQGTYQVRYGEGFATSKRVVGWF